MLYEVITIVWACLPRFDSDPAFCALLANSDPQEARGLFAVELKHHVRSEHRYLPNTAILETVLYDENVITSYSIHYTKLYELLRSVMQEELRRPE